MRTLVLLAIVGSLGLMWSCASEEEETVPERKLERPKAAKDPFASAVLHMALTRNYDTLNALRVPDDLLADALRWPKSDSSYKILQQKKSKAQPIFERMCETLRSQMEFYISDLDSTYIKEVTYTKEGPAPTYRMKMKVSHDGTVKNVIVEHIWIVDRKKYLDVSSTIFLEKSQPSAAASDTTSTADSSKNEE